MPSDTFSHSTTVSSPADAVITALQDPETWKGIGPIDSVWDARHDDGALSSFRWSARAAGRSWEGTATRRPPRDGAAMTLGLDSPEVGGEISVALSPNGDGTVLTVTMVARSKGLLAGMFWGVISDALRSGLPAQVEEFGAGLRASDGA